MSKEFSGTIITKGIFEIKENEVFLLLFLPADRLKQTQAADGLQYIATRLTRAVCIYI
jgi:hypothetical protein